MGKNILGRIIASLPPWATTRKTGRVCVWVVVVAFAFVVDPLIELVLEGEFEFVDRQHFIEGAVFALAMIALFVGFELYVHTREKSRRAVEDSEERFRNLIEGSLQGIWVHRDLNLLFVNQALVEIYGYDSPRELLAMGDVNQLIAPHERDRLVGYYYRRIAGGDPVSHYEFEGLHKDGSLVWLESQNRQVNWEGKPAIQATLLDITERKKAEFAQRESEGRLSSILNNANAIIYMKDMDGRYFFINHYFENVLGKSNLEVSGKTDFDFLPADYAESLNTNDCLVLEGGRPMEFEEVTPLGDEPQTYLSLKFPLEDLSGSVYGLCGISTNITDRRREETERARLSAAVDQGADAIFMSDAGGVIQFVNPAFERLTGYGRAEAVGANPLTLEIGLGEKGKYREIWNVLTSGEAWRGELQCKRKDGELFDGEASITPVHGANGELVNFIALLKDITEQNKAEAALREAKESAEAATKLKDQFVSLVAHDLRSPFASIIGYMELMRDDDRHPLDEHQQEVLGRVLEKGESLVKMIDELLNISRLQTGKIVPEFHFVDAQFVTSLARGYINQTAADKGIDISNEVPPGMRIYTDMNLLGEVFQNLLSNAIKFSLTDGTIRMFIPPDQPNCIAVADLGMGVEEAILPDLFRHEVKTTTTGTAGERGTGLGLPFCNDMMAALGGNLRVESTLGEGTTFYVDLPHIRPQILIADDEQEHRDKLREHLDDLGVDVVEADDGESAVRKIAETPPHLIITDVGMPKLDGFGVLEAVKTNPDTRTIPILLISSDTETETRDKAFRLGADDFLNKPIEPGEFIPRVRRFLG